MKKLLSVLLIFTMLLCTALPCYAADAGNTYYIDAENGNDSNSGTSESSAWKTLAFALSKTYSEGDKILLKAGSVFDGSFTVNGSGKADSPVVLGAYGDIDTLGKPIIRSDEEEIVLLNIKNVSGWTVENIGFTAPNGSGIYVRADGGKLTSDITIRNCVFHDIWYKQCDNHNGNHCPIYIRSSGTGAHIRNLTIQNCNIYDCAFGIKMSGLTREHNPDLFVSPEESYNTDYLIEGMSLNNILHDGIMIMSVNGMTIRNSSFINTSVRDSFPSAPVWAHHAKNYVIENCEIAGATNEKDGMAVDFDGWATDAAYQYIYSHDNVRFINNCCCDNYTRNENCTVRYCLSVNDNKLANHAANLICVRSYDYAEDEAPVCMDNFKFYNNTLVNCSQISFATLTNSYVANNIFVGNKATDSVQYMKKNVGLNENFKTKFSGVFTNNCFWNMGVPPISENNFICNPKFAGTDETDKNSYILSTESKLLGKGITVEDDMGEHDFYGNELTDVHNIGCYEGAGEQMQDKTGFFKDAGSFLSLLFATVWGFFMNLSNTYWLF